jgi:acetyl-CoA carboxylase biotin carboxyl carrier protein
MDIKFVQQIVAMIEKSNVHEIELELKGVKIRVTKNSEGHPAGGNPYPVMMPQHLYTPQAQAQNGSIASSEPAAPVAVIEEKKYKEIKSPIVGTFYRAPSPDGEPYTDVGSQIKPGNVLCIVEAMKLMNEIEADIAGTIVKVCVENGKPVEYNQVLFLVEP